MLFIVDGIVYKTTSRNTVQVGDGEGRAVDWEKRRIDKIIQPVQIPDTVLYKEKKYTVTSIGSRAFHYCDLLSSVTLPESLTSIEDHAFINCSDLISLTFPASLTSIGDKAFYNCHRLTSMTLPPYLQTIGCEAFSYCSGLTCVTLPASLTIIEDYAFGDCESLTSATLSASLKTVCEGAFYQCANLKNIFCNFDEEPFVDKDAFLHGPFHRTIHTHSEYVDIVPFCANRRMVIAKN